MSRLNVKQCAALLGVKEREFSKCRPFLTGFPSPVYASRNPLGRKLFDRDQVLAWAADIDLEAAMRDAMRRFRGCVDIDEVTAQRLALAKQFIAGGFDRPDRQAAYALRRMTARTCKPKTLRIPARSDWALENA